MDRKPYIPADGKTLELTNIMLMCDGDLKEVHVGGVCTFKDVQHQPDVKEYVQNHLGKEIKVESYSYELMGESHETRPATKEEIEIIIDDFPNSKLYDKNLRCVDNEDGIKHPHGFEITIHSLEELQPSDNQGSVNMPTTFTITGFMDEKIELTPHLMLVEVTDFMQGKQHNIGLLFTHEDEGEESPFASLTLNFGEFIGTKNCAYVDTNNCWFADEILETGIAEDTGLTKLSGFCKYPLWHFKEEFLEAIDKDVYQKYSDEYDEYMKAAMPDEEFDEEPIMEM